jgi:hypothetical protein
MDMPMFSRFYSVEIEFNAGHPDWCPWCPQCPYRASFTARLGILADLSGIADALQEIADGNTSFVQVQAVTGYNTPSISRGGSSRYPADLRRRLDAGKTARPA